MHIKPLLQFSIFFLLLSIIGCYQNTDYITDISQLNDSHRSVGAGVASKGYLYVTEHFPSARFKSLEINEGLLELRTGKLDAYIQEDLSVRYNFVANNIQGLQIIVPPDADTVNSCVGISKNPRIPGLKDSINVFISELKASGQLDQIINRWLNNPNASIPQIDKAEKPKQKLIVGTSAIVPPITFKKGTQLAGIDIELARLFAQKMGYGIEFKIYDYNSIIMALASGSIDCIFANLNWTEERAQSIDFSIPYLQMNTAVVIRDTKKSKDVFNSLADLKGKRIGSLGTTATDPLLRETFNDYESVFFNGINDVLIALSNRKIDGALLDRPEAMKGVADFQDLAILGDVIDGVYGFPIAKNSPLIEKINATIAEFQKDGTIESLLQKWTTNFNSETRAIKQDWDAPNGTITVGTDPTLVPITFMINGEYGGFDIDIFNSIAKRLGYRVKYVSLDFSGLLASISAKKIELAVGGFNITDERKQTVDFTIPYLNGSISLVVRKENLASANSASNQQVVKTSFLEELKNSFEKNFIRESRWKSVLEGLKVTMIISVCSGIIGIVLGFIVCLMRRNRNPISNAANIVFVKVIQGTPIVVLLMIIYYIIFGSIDIPGIIAAIIGFSINFAAYTSEMIRSGLNTVDPGQIEASYAIGYNKAQTFWKIVFPQAARNFLPAVRGEFISLLKNTSIVGYIAVVDLTKATDIIRSRTMDAFFPLILTAIIYFLISWLIAAILENFEKKLDPKRRRRQ